MATGPFRQTFVRLRSTSATVRSYASSIIPYNDPSVGEGATGGKPSPTPTPLSGTWQDGSEPPKSDSSAKQPPASRSSQMVTVMVCPLTGMRATDKCPQKEARTFKSGSEPKEFCTFHR